MTDAGPYTIHMDPSHQPLKLIDVTAMSAEVTETWFNQTLCRVDESLVRLGVVEGEYHWHQHDDADEFFFVVDGRLVIEVEGQEEIELAPGQGTVIPKGREHRPIAPVRTVMLMIERAGVVPTGDSGGAA